MLVMLIIFILTLIGIFFLLKSKIDCASNLANNNLVTLENNFKELTLKDENLKNQNLKKEEVEIRTMNLYEATKEIFEFLEQDKIFNSFRNGLNKFIQFEECEYYSHLDPNKDLSGFEVVPLKVNSDNYGYLAIKGLSQTDRPTLDFLGEQFLVAIKRARLYELVQKLSITDALTKTSTRLHFFDRFGEELRRSKELNLDLSFLMIDIDNFKSFNDKYGHLVGDAILKSVADIIRFTCREIDLIGRFGGEEFMVALPMTSKEGAVFAAERIRKSVESTQIKAFDEMLSVTISIGIASFPQDASLNQELIDKADWALYRSKRTGKNKVSVYARYK